MCLIGKRGQGEEMHPHSQIILTSVKTVRTVFHQDSHRTRTCNNGTETDNSYVTPTLTEILLYVHAQILKLIIPNFIRDCYLNR